MKSLHKLFGFLSPSSIDDNERLDASSFDNAPDFDFDYVGNGTQKMTNNHYCPDENLPIIKGLDDFRSKWYSMELQVLDEKELYTSKSQIYRFSYFPSFTSSIVVRIEINNDGISKIYYKVSEPFSFKKEPFSFKKKRWGKHWGRHGILKFDKSELNEIETQNFLDLLSRMDYWRLPMENRIISRDGCSIIFEGIKEGVYHIVDRHNPQMYDPVSSIEKYFFDLIQEKFSMEI